MGDAVQEALMKGVGAHKAGQLDQAKELYASVIQVEPRHPDANHNWGWSAYLLLSLKYHE